LIITVADEDPAKNITEAGFDHFSITESSILNTADVSSDATEIRLFPNPTSDKITLVSKETQGIVRLFNYAGMMVMEQEKTEEIQEIDLSNFPNGIYFVEFTGTVFKVIKD
jgi:hypothetical protein